MIIARYPNTGFLTVEKVFSNPNIGFSDKNLKQKNGYWNGSIVRIKTENWAYEYSNIQNFANGKVTLNDPTYYPIKSNWGYFIDNNFNELDYAKEWFFQKLDTNKGIIYLQVEKETDIRNSLTEASVFDFGIFARKDLKNVIIRDIVFKNQYKNGIWFAGNSTNVTIENCTFKGQFLTGISFTKENRSSKVNNCRFNSINGKAIFVLKSKKMIFSNNIIKNIGMMPGYGTTGDAYPMSSIVILGDSSHIFRNYINFIGHDAINCTGAGNVIEKNTIKNCLLYLNDGGAIKCFGDFSKNSTWRNNFIFNVEGNIEATDKKYNEIRALGIYLDENTNNLKIEKNTLINCKTAGIGMNAGFENYIENNICYNNNSGLFFYQSETLCRNNIVKNNIISSTNENQYSVILKSMNLKNKPGTFDYNTYCITENINDFRIFKRNVVENYTFKKWKDFIDSDENSVQINDKKIGNSKIFNNMSDDSLKILLKPDIKYKDIALNNIYGSVLIEPWFSTIIFADSDLSKLPELSIAGGPINFGKVDDGKFSTPMWYNLFGENLENKVTINAPNGFEVSISDDSKYSNSITVYTNNGKLDQIIFIRFIPDSEKRYYDFIENQSGKVSSRLKVMGTSR